MSPRPAILAAGESVDRWTRHAGKTLSRGEVVIVAHLNGREWRGCVVSHGDFRGRLILRVQPCDKGAVRTVPAGALVARVVKP